MKGMAVNLRDEAINELVGQKPPFHLNEIWAIRMCNEAGREEYGVGDATWIRGSCKCGQATSSDETGTGEIPLRCAFGNLAR